MKIENYCDNIFALRSIMLPMYIPIDFFKIKEVEELDYMIIQLKLIHFFFF